MSQLLYSIMSNILCFGGYLERVPDTKEGGVVLGVGSGRRWPCRFMNFDPASAS